MDARKASYHFYDNDSITISDIFRNDTYYALNVAAVVGPIYVPRALGPSTYDVWEDEDEPIVVTRTKIQLGPFLYANNKSDNHYEL